MASHEINPVLPRWEERPHPARVTIAINYPGRVAVRNFRCWLSAAKLIAVIERPLSDLIADIRDSELE